MIRLERTKGEGACAALAHKDRHGLTETEHALWHFGGIIPAVPNLPNPKAPTFKAYKRPEVIAELTAIFGKKCSYCESVHGHVGPMDVEHYRPKSGYLDDKGVVRKPGYYWLAASWDNLLASCPDCNRERRQLRLSNGKLVTKKLGKGNRFPIAAGTERAISQAGLATERPLLLNPCTDWPEQHLHFRSDGFIDAADTPEEANLPKGRTTIDVCGLEREGLRGERCAHASRLAAQMKSVLKSDRNVARAPGCAFEQAELAIAENDLASYRASTAPYLALAAQMMRTFNHIRPIALAYVKAHDAWRRTENAEDRAELVTQVAVVRAAVVNPTLDGKLAKTLLETLDLLPVEGVEAE
jgi:uncharacterized protein (TIGR02646 family)